MAQNENKLTIRNTTAEFLTFAYQTGGDGIEVRVQDGTVWLSQKLIASLFDTQLANINMHITNIITETEIDETATIKDFLIVQKEGERTINRKIKHYNLDMIIAVGYRVNSAKATEFRRWATVVLRDFALRGYLIDKKRMENGMFLDDDYFERLLEEIREIRLSERRFYQKITDIYSTSMDYDKSAETTKTFFAKVQNKLHWAVHHHTAAELIYKRADSTKEHMGLTTWEKAPSGKIVKSDVSIAKNYLTEQEMQDLELIVSGYLDLAEGMARRKIPMTMADWAEQLDMVLKASKYEILDNLGTITAEIAKAHAENEFEKYRVIQDRLFKSDYDEFLSLKDIGRE
ncbi:MAG: virulence RhuM family protein [Oscillospiraceae bacterium]|nr:virulence RhuM family protein [Oscillospiraceae bacterium]